MCEISQQNLCWLLRIFMNGDHPITVSMWHVGGGSPAYALHGSVALISRQITPHRHDGAGIKLMVFPGTVAGHAACCCGEVDVGLVGAKLQNATSDFFELDLSKNHSPVKWLP